MRRSKHSSYYYHSLLYLISIVQHESTSNTSTSTQAGPGKADHVTAAQGKVRWGDRSTLLCVHECKTHFKRIQLSSNRHISYFSPHSFPLQTNLGIYFILLFDLIWLARAGADINYTFFGCFLDVFWILSYFFPLFHSNRPPSHFPDRFPRRK